MEDKKTKQKTKSQKYRDAKGKVDKNKQYLVNDAIKLVRETSYSKFVGSLEMHAIVNKTGIAVDMELAHSTGKDKKIEVADEKTIEKLEKGVVDFDVLLATAEMMPKLVKYARLLGPKGLMPNPKTGTVIKSVADAKKFSGNKIRVKTEKGAPVIHMNLGKLGMNDKDLVENFESVINAIGKNRFVKIYLTASMGPSVKVAI